MQFTKEGSGTSCICCYLRNAQGDVVEMIDSSGSVVVKYMYDSWGKHGQLGKYGSIGWMGLVVSSKH